jgi:hypothetical protein
MPLTHAAYYGANAALARLLELRANVNAQNPDG